MRMICILQSRNGIGRFMQLRGIIRRRIVLQPSPFTRGRRRLVCRYQFLLRGQLEFVGRRESLPLESRIIHQTTEMLPPAFCRATGGTLLFPHIGPGGRTEMTCEQSKRTARKYQRKVIDWLQPPISAAVSERLREFPRGPVRRSKIENGEKSESTHDLLRNSLPLLAVLFPSLP